MEIGMVGLGRMGGNMAQRLLNGGHKVVAYDANVSAVESLTQQGATGASSLENLKTLLSPPRAVWVMVPSGTPTEDTISSLAKIFSPGDIIIDGGNSNYKESMRRSSWLSGYEIKFLDVGTSGGVWGLQGGYSLMIGGDEEAFHSLKPLFECLAPDPDRGFGYVGPAGAGHFVKMVHNGIEYGMMQAYAEGFELMQAKTEFDLDLGYITEIWRFGSVVRSWLLDLTADALREDPTLEHLEAYVEDSGEGRWTVQESLDLAIPLPVITLALQARFRSRQDHPFGARLLSAMRNQFGGHGVKERPVNPDLE